MPTRPDLYLCNNYRQLMLALASCYTIPAAVPTPCIVYLEDAVPMQESLKAVVAQKCPYARVFYTTDKAEQEAFERLGRWFPELFRRNLSLQNGRPVTPAGWGGVVAGLGTDAFVTGYFSHAGFFTAKLLASRCTRVVMRESGINNYITLKPPPFKALLRCLTGQSPFKQVWGEQRWINSIEVSQPERLPARVRFKGVRRGFDDYMALLPAETATDLAALFLDGDVPRTLPKPSALVLTQPLAALSGDQNELMSSPFDAIVNQLKHRGFTVWHKPHPREACRTLSGTLQLPPRFPVEAWSYCGLPTFDIAVALHSASLALGEIRFARRSLQLLSQAEVSCLPLGTWEATISQRLRDFLDNTDVTAASPASRP